MMNDVSFLRHTIGCILCTAKINDIFCLTVCIVKYLPRFVCLLALECCCSFHLLATYISSFWLHSVHLASFKVFKSFLILPFFIQCFPIISCMFLFSLNAAIGSFLKIYLRFLFTCKIFQFFLMVLVIFSRNQLYVITRGILYDLYIYIYLSIYIYIYVYIYKFW